jgi:hypothetical protein
MTKPHVMHGQQEIEWWANGWAAGGIAEEDLNTKSRGSCIAKNVAKARVCGIGSGFGGFRGSWVHWRGLRVYCDGFLFLIEIWH